MCGSVPAPARPALTTTTDLQRDGQAALGRRLPLLLEFSATDCPHCQRVEQEFLLPPVDQRGVSRPGSHRPPAVERRCPR